MDTRYLKRAAAAFGIAGLGLLAVPAAAAQAAAAPDEPSGRHCVAYVTGAGSAGAVTASSVEPQCFDSFGEALERASGGRLTKGPKNAGEAVRDPGFRARVDAANAQADRARGVGTAVVNTVISIEYTGSGWTGSDLIWVGHSGNCTTSTNNTDYEISSMPAGWDNIITAYELYANCWGEHFENQAFGGASVGYHGTRSYIGAAMDNRTSSQRWS